MTDYAISLHNIESPGITAWESDVLQEVTYALNVNDVTELEVVIPYSTKFPSGVIGRTTTAKLWRRPRGMSTYYVEGTTEWMLSKYVNRVSEDSRETRLIFFHPNALLQRRLVAYKQDTLYADKTFDNSNLGQTWALMLAYFQENFGSLAGDVNRRIDSTEYKIYTGFISEGLREFSAPWRNLLTVLQELSGYKEDGGVRYFFNLSLLDGVPVFTLKPSFLGADLSDSVTFGPNFGNVNEVEVIEDYGREINYCYAGGEGTGIEQWVQEVYITVPPPLLRSEGFESMGDIDVAEVLTEHGLRYLARNRAKRLIKAKVQDVGAFLYGRNYQQGDLVGLAVGGQAYKCHVYAVSVNASESGENVDVYLEAEDLL